MGLVYDHYHVEPVNDEEIALVVGGERAPTARSVARKVIRVALTIAAAFLILNAYIVPLNFWVRPRQAESLRAAAGPHDRTWDDFEFGEEIKCYGKDDFEPIEPEEPYPEQLQWVKVPDTVLDSDDIYFFARSNPESGGRTTGGGIVFDAVDDVDQITVGAVIGYEHHPYAKLCTYKRENGALGFGVVVPKREHHHDDDDKHEPHHPPAEPRPPRRPHDRGPDPHPPHRRHRFHRANIVHLRVKFPLAKEGQTFRVKNLETSLPLYRHIIGDLGDKVEFSSISLRGSNSPIFSESLSAATADVRTTNAPIDGNFTGTNELSIYTINAPVKVHIAFTSTLADAPARLSVGTLNAKLDAEIGLAAGGDAGVGSFEVVATTANAPLLVAFTDAPVGSQLSLDANTANAPADVILHPTYEGTVEAKTAWFEASLNVRDDSEDPAGKGRKRNVQVTKVNRSFFQGEVTWGEKTDDTPAGEVTVHTSLSRVSVTV